MIPVNSLLIDGCRRRLNYLRISITDRCNLNCLYCNPRIKTRKLLHKNILRYEEILRIIRIGVRLGITKVRITGGEPLVRKGCFDFLDQVGGIEGIEDISLTTNGVLLKPNIDRIMAAGIRRLNISIDTLDRRKYEKITGEDVLDKVWEGIWAALEKGCDPVKLNVVALRGINEDELTALAELSIHHPFHVRFIECMPIGRAMPSCGPPLLSSEIKTRIRELGTLHPVNSAVHDGPAQRFKFENAIGEVGFISPLSRHFCASCNRLRLTADGHILSCLLSDVCEDIKTPLRKGLLDEDLADVFIRAVKQKPAAHAEIMPSITAQPESMNAIGG
jgi:GTP 3',8-cyclase